MRISGRTGRRSSLWRLDRSANYPTWVRGWDKTCEDLRNEKYNCCCIPVVLLSFVRSATSPTTTQISVCRFSKLVCTNYISGKDDQTKPKQQIITHGYDSGAPHVRSSNHRMTAAQPVESAVRKWPTSLLRKLCPAAPGAYAVGGAAKQQRPRVGARRSAR